MEQPNIDSGAPVPGSYRELEIEAAEPPVRLRLNPPVEYDGHSYVELIFDFDKLIGKDFQRAEREFRHTYKSGKNEVVIPEMTQDYRVILAAHTANVPRGVIDKLPAKAYTKVTNEVLKLYGSSPEAENE